MTKIPDHFDVIILGTGLTNSILAAACSRIGKSVLHLDEDSYYGNDWASFTFQQLVDWIRLRNPGDKSLTEIPESLINKSRMFCIDLTPKFLFSNGQMVDLLVKSNVARYHEFKNNIRILCMIGEDIHVLPCRRNEVFTSPLLRNLADKRRLMKFIELCMKYNSNCEDGLVEQSDIQTYGDQSIAEYLDNRGLKGHLRDYIINSIAMVRSSDPLTLACKRVKEFMVATERYGKSPFLFPLYGCGEFPQSFCRLSAVFGGLYCLNTPVKGVSMNSDTTNQNDELHKIENEPKFPVNTGQFSVTFSDENHIAKSDMLVLEKRDTAVTRLLNITIPKTKISRVIFITNNSIISKSESDTPSEKELVSFLRLPQDDQTRNLVLMIELNSSTLVCPKELNIVYLWTKASSDDPEADLKSTVDRLFLNKDECILWKFYYQLPAEFDNTECTQPDVAPLTTGLYLSSPFCDDIDYASNIKEAELLFNKMCPDEEFLPRAPDPDEIIST